LKRFANIENKWNLKKERRVHILVAIGNNAFGGLQGIMARHVSSTNSFIHDNFLRGGIMSKFLAYSKQEQVQILGIRIKNKTKREKNCILFNLSKNKNKHKKGANTSHNKGPQENYNI
jgi:hypothetical protein